MYMRQQAIFLDLPGATGEELNTAWQKQAAETYARDHSPAEAAQWIEAFRKAANCI
jgi:hypothetical protein